MRQMGPRYRPYSDHTVLLVGDYTGQGATCEQFVKTMATAGIRVMFESAVLSTLEERHCAPIAP